MVIQNHPKMVQMWANRCAEIRNTRGLLAANHWAREMFTEEQRRDISRILQKEKAKNESRPT